MPVHSKRPYDADGNVSAVFDLKKDAGRVHMDANFADGVYLSITSIFGSVTVESNNAACVAERMRVRLPPHAAALHPYSKGIFTTIGAWAKAKVVSSHLERVAAQTSRVA